MLPVDYCRSPEHPSAYDDRFTSLRFLHGEPDPGPGAGAQPIDAARNPRSERRRYTGNSSCGGAARWNGGAARR